MITSIHNRQIKDIIALNSKAKERSSRALFAAEGIKIFGEAPKELIHSVFVSASFEEKNRSILYGSAYEIIEDGIFAKICDTKTPQGILTVLHQPKYKYEQLLASAAPFLMILENVRDPGNVGTIIRSAEGAGVDGIILSKGRADIFTPKTIRSTMGSIFRVPFIYEENLADAMKRLDSAGIRTYGAYLNGGSRIYTEHTYKDGCAIVIGNESRGLSDETASMCDRLIHIPMCGQLESLNAAVAAAVLMYNVNRSRRN